MPLDNSNSKMPVFTGTTVYFFKDSESAIIPKYAKPGDAGMDLYSNVDQFLSKGERYMISTGIKVKIPEGTVGMVCPRSGLAAKEGITVVNAPGIIDSEFSGEIKVAIINHSKHGYQIKKGDRIAQLVIVPFISCQTLEKTEWDINTDRGEGGFGSSGK